MSIWTVALAVPAESGFGGEVAFEDGAGVDVVALRPAHVLHGEVEILQPGLDHIVVVVIPRIARDAVLRIRLGVSREVVEGEANHCLRAGENNAGIRAALQVALQPLHVARVSVVDPLQELIGMSGPTGRGDATVVEAEPGGDELHVGLGGRGIDAGVKHRGREGRRE